MTLNAIDPQPLDPATLRALQGVTTATLTTVLLKKGLRNVWIRGALPLAERLPERRVGRAFTLRFVPAREDLATPASWASPISTRAAIEAMPAGCIAVVDAMGISDAGIFGDILCARMQKRGVAALVTDGVVRDLAGVLGTGLPVWCQGAAAPASVDGLTFVGWQEPIGCGGVAVIPNDVVVADGDGAVRDSGGARRRRRRRRGRAGAARGLDHARGRARRAAARPLSGQRRDQGTLRRLGRGRARGQDLAPGDEGLRAALDPCRCRGLPARVGPGAVVPDRPDQRRRSARAGRCRGHRRARHGRRDLEAAEDAGAARSIVPAPAAPSARSSVVQAKKDGQTILFAQNSALTFRVVLDPQSVSYDALRDLVPLGIASRTPSVLVVRSDAPYRSFAELIEYARKNPGQVRIGHPGAGSVGDFCVQLINALTGAELVPIPYAGAAPPSPHCAADTSKASCWRSVR